jgi:hypothetical protein
MKELARIFTGKKMIDIPILNKMGLQVWRIKMAGFRHSLRPKLHDDKIFEDDTQSFDKNGAIVKKEFLDTDFYGQVKTEAQRALKQDMDKGKENFFGDNKKVLINILDLDEDSYPALYKLLKSSYVTNLFRFATRRPLSFTKKEKGSLAQIEYLLQGDDSKEDVETQIHSDIYHSSFKAWLYLNDISMEHGPLTYFMKSRNNDKAKLNFEYQNSIKPTPDKSRRITKEELEKRDLKETVMNVKENTFVMADINGYHRRLKGEKGKERLAIIFRERGNPFN